MTTSTLRMGKCEWGLLLILSLLWGTSFSFFKVLVAELPPLTIVLGRVALAAAALNILLAVRRAPMPKQGPLWRRFAILGLLNNILPFTLIVFGETRISSGLASIVNATTPIFTVLAAHLLTDDERLTVPKSIGVGFGVLGVTVLVGRAAGRGDLVGVLACLAAAVSYAFAGLYGRRFRGIPPLQIATGQVSASAALLLPVVAIVDRPWTLPAPSPAAWAALAGIALLSTAAAYLIYFRILAAAGATNLLLVTFLLPITALALGTIVLGETVTLQALAGMALIGIGLLAIDGRALRRR